MRCARHGGALVVLCCLTCALRASADGRDDFLIGAAGVPVSLLGRVEGPAFEEVFLDLQRHGFNAFFPSLLTKETGEGTNTSGHEVYFWDMDPASPTFCGGAHSPYQAARGKLGIIFPAYILVPPDEWSSEVDAEELRRHLTRFRDECLSGDAYVLAAFENFDEPASNFVARTFVPEEGPRIELDSLARVADLLKDTFPDVPVMVVEGAVPFVIDRDPAARAMKDEIDKVFQQAIGETVGPADWYGFDVYPVPHTPDLGVVGDYVHMARELAPGKRIVSVLQGFGEEDLGRVGRRPTPAENRCMAYLSVIDGAEGIIWWGQSAMDIAESAELWESIKSTAREIRRIAPLLRLPSVAVDSGNANVRVLGKADDDTTWMLAANPLPSDEPVSFRVTVDEGRGPADECSVVDRFSATELTPRTMNGAVQFDDRLEPYAVRLYSIE